MGAGVGGGSYFFIAEAVFEDNMNTVRLSE